MHFDVISLMPEMLAPFASMGVIGKAVEKGIISIKCWNPRSFSHDARQTVDDRPYGGGPGMVLKVEPLLKCIEQVQSTRPQRAKVIYLSPQGIVFKQEHAAKLATSENLVLLAGRYEGIDQRLIEMAVDEEYSIGDYVLSGGELPAMVMIDAIARHVPNVLGHAQSLQQDSFVSGLLDCPHYTRPVVYEGKAVPQVLLSGDHGKIAKWRQQQALLQTRLKRPDLYAKWLLQND